MLFQRGLYPAENFESVQQYGITLLMSKDEKIRAYMNEVLGQLEQWLATDKVEHISMIVKDVKTKEVVESWVFNVQSQVESKQENVDPNKAVSSKDLKKIQAEIRDVMRQIAATVSYLPLLESVCAFDILVHTKKDIEIPDAWKETCAVKIENCQTVRLKSFSTGLQKVETVVNYKLTE